MSDYYDCFGCGSLVQWGHCEHRKRLEEEQRKQTQALQDQTRLMERQAEQSERERNFAETGSYLTDNERFAEWFAQTAIGSAVVCIFLYGILTLILGCAGIEVWTSRILAFIVSGTALWMLRKAKAQAQGRTKLPFVPTLVASGLFLWIVSFFMFRAPKSPSAIPHSTQPSPSTQTASAPATSQERVATVTLKDFNSLKIYMTLTDVEKILGTNKVLTERANTGIPNQPLLYYRWVYQNGSSVECTFQGENLITMTQKGLK